MFTVKEWLPENVTYYLYFSKKLPPLSACVFTFCTTNGKARKNITGWQGDDASNPHSPKQNNATPTEAMEFVQGNLLPFCLPTWGDDKNTRKCLKNWIRITGQWLLSSEVLGRTGNWVSALPRIARSILPVLWGEGNETMPTQLVSSKARHTQELLWFLAKMSVCFPSFSPFIFKAFHVSYLSVCYGLNGAPLPKCLCWRPNTQCLRMWPYVEKRSLKRGLS